MCMLRLLYNQIKKLYKYGKKQIRFWCFLRYPIGRKIYILGSPSYTNLGDSAILIAQIEFLKKSGIEPKRIKEISFDEYYEKRNIIKKNLSRNSLICGMGGGNMGNVWAWEEEFRHDIFNDFPDNPTVIFPQTIYFTDDEKGKLDKERTASYYNEKKKLILVARETESYKIMNMLYKKAEILMTPDIVLSLNRSDFNIIPIKRQDVLICARNDQEKIISDNVWEDLEREINGLNENVNRIDMYAEETVTKSNRRMLVTQKMQEFASAKFVLTDRLHGMVFSAITETPCIVFSNYNYKVLGTYEWISNLPYIRYVESIEEAKKAIPEMLLMSDCKFDNTHLQDEFIKIMNAIKAF